MEDKRPEITEEPYADLMKKCWDSDPENRPTAEEIRDCFFKYHHYYKEGSEEWKIIELTELKRQEINKSEKYLEYLVDEKNHKNHPKPFYISRPLNELIEKAKS